MTILRLVVFGFLLSIATTFVAAQELNPQDDPAVQRVAPFQVFDNLYYVGAKWVSAWLLVSDQGLILFDSLYGELTDLVIDGIRELGFDPDDVRYVIVTHAHFDHIGGARRFQEEFGSVVMMTDADWQMTDEPAIYRDYPKPVRHLSVADGSTLNLGRTRLRFMVTPGHTPGVLSTRFTVYDRGYPHDAFMFGGVGLNFSGVERTESYINSVQRLQQLPDIEVNIPNHEGSGEVFERYEILQDRQDGDPHPFVDPESWTAWLEILLLNAQSKLDNEREAAGVN
ncbi:MAG: MBL fold metallo-hydrolase [Proteobacteria bacterium]|nr:MBL fold metallo-hydrolase [Pseudomonadota bacterium]